MICPNADCRHAFDPATSVRGLTICPGCLASVLADGSRRAHAGDTGALSQAEDAALRQLRAKTRKARA